MASDATTLARRLVDAARIAEAEGDVLERRCGAGKSAKCWKTVVTGRLAGRTPLTRSPAMYIVPLVGSSCPTDHVERRRLAATPTGRAGRRTRPFSTVRLTSSTASTPPGKMRLTSREDQSPLRGGLAPGRAAAALPPLCVLRLLQARHSRAEELLPPLKDVVGLVHAGVQVLKVRVALLVGAAVAGRPTRSPRSCRPGRRERGAALPLASNRPRPAQRLAGEARVPLAMLAL